MTSEPQRTSAGRLPFLKSGIELIDSPGRNENDALDDVVDTFFEKGTTPLIVYIIDGNQQLRQSVSTSK